MNAKHAKPKADNYQTVRLVGDAILRLHGKQEAPGTFLMQSFEGMLPGHVELGVNPEAAEFAWHNGPRIEVEVCGKKIRTEIITMNTQTKVLFLLAVPFLRSLAKAIAAYDSYRRF